MKTTLDLLQLKDFQKHVMHLDQIERFGSRVRNIRQSVAGHTYTVAQLCILICYQLNIKDNTFRFALIQEALNHDILELYTGDIPTISKDKMKESLLSLEQFFEEQEFIKYPWLKPIFKNDDEQTLAHSIVKIADKIDLERYLKIYETTGLYDFTESIDKGDEVIRAHINNIQTLLINLPELTNA